jgi:hypothetical protein
MVIADTSTNSAERDRTDLKNIMFAEIVVYLVFDELCESWGVSLVLS